MILQEIFLALSCLMFIFNCTQTKTIRKLQVDRAEQCGSAPNSPLKLIYLNIIQDEVYGIHYEGALNITRDLVSNKIKGEGELTRCSSKELLDSCEAFTKLVPPNPCALLSMKNAAWSAGVASIKPPFKCPIKKGHYYSKNATFDANLFRVFPVLNFYWKLKANLYENNIFLASFCIEGKIIERNINNKK